MRDQTSKNSVGQNKPYLLPLLLLAGAAAGFAIGGLFGSHWSDPSWGFFVGFIRLLGDVFMNILKALVIPLIVCSMIVGVSAMGDLRRIGGLFGFTFGYYILTTVISVTIGLLLVNLIQPGIDAGTAAAAAPHIKETVVWYEAVFKLVSGMFPNNLAQAAADSNILGLIVFSLVFGGILTTLGEKGRRAIDFIDTLNEALLKLVRMVIWLAPIGILGLVANRIGAAGGGMAVWVELSKLVKYFLTVITGLGIHAFIVLPALLYFLSGRNPVRHLRHFAEALIMAFSTASSAATLPVTIGSAREKAGISEEASGFVLPLGATVNMDGTALYEAVAVVFIAQAYGIELSFVEMLIVMLTATLAAIGAAAIPEAGLVTMVMVLTAVKVPVEGVGLLLSIDWFLDRFRTTVNVWGDAVGCSIVEKRIESLKRWTNNKN
jgi:solute carrier family 1 (neuronal/epithelial high affinity glutamate transporter), member 1